MNDDSDFIKRLLVVAPRFAHIYQEHLVDNDELLPHVLMGDFTRWFIQLFRESLHDRHNSSHAEAQLHQVSQFLEGEWERGAPKVRNLIAVSFLENLHQAGDDYAGVKAVLGPGMARQLSEIE